MDGERFDAIAKRLGTVPSRRALLHVIGGSILGAGTAAFRLGSVAADCPRRKRCGRDCCAPERCFVTQNGKKFCCRRDKICPDPRDPTGASDQCCYRDEVCSDTSDPDWHHWGPCCRTCGGSCCIGATLRCDDSGQFCENTGVARPGRFSRF